MKAPRYPAPEEFECVPYRQKRPERYRTSVQKHGGPGEDPPYYRRPVKLGYQKLKRQK